MFRLFLVNNLFPDQASLTDIETNGFQKRVKTE